MFEARCTLRGDLQEEGVDYDPEALYAPVATHESIRILLCLAASQDLMLEGFDITNAYPHGKPDVPIIMHHRQTQSEYYTSQVFIVFYINLYMEQNRQVVYGAIPFTKNYYSGNL